MIDLHTHILPGIDDGARTLDDALEMARAFVADGVTTIAATPHVRDDFPTSAGVMLDAVDALRHVLAGEGIPFVTIDQDRPRVEHMRQRGVHAVFGDAARGGLLRHAGLAGARMLVVTAPEPIRARLIVDEARRLRPDISIVVRVHTEADLATFQRLGVERVVLGERELAFGMARHVVRTMRGARVKSEVYVKGEE